MKKINYKQEIQRLTGWSTEEYNKKYDIYRLRVRAFERETGKTEKINAAASFYYTIKGQKAGKALTPQKRAILATPALSTAKKTRGKKTSAAEKRARAYLEYRLAGLFTVNPKLKEFFYNEEIAWYIREQRVKDYLNSLNGTKKAQIQRASEKINKAEIGDIADLFEDYGDSGYELDFEF